MWGLGAAFVGFAGENVRQSLELGELVIQLNAGEVTRLQAVANLGGQEGKTGEHFVFLDENVDFVDDLSQIGDTGVEFFQLGQTALSFLVEFLAENFVEFFHLFDGEQGDFIGLFRK